MKIEFDISNSHINCRRFNVTDKNKSYNVYVYFDYHYVFKDEEDITWRLEGMKIFAEVQHYYFRNSEKINKQLKGEN